MKPDVALIFIVGASRSGTTMLNQLLGRNSQILALNELHYIGDRWRTTKAESWDLDRAEQETARLLATARRSIWDSSPTSQELQEASEIMSGLEREQTGPADVYARTLDYLCRRAGKSLVIDQTPRNIFFAREMLDRFPGAQVVQLSRDPRAVLYSQRNRWRQKWLGASQTPLWNSIRVRINYHPVTMSRLWVRAYESGTALLSHPRFLRIPFEGLVHEPENYLKKICGQIGVEYEKEMLDIPKIGSSTRRHDNEDRGVDEGVADAWRGKLPNADTWICQKMTAAPCRALGYDDVNGGFPILVILLQIVLLPLHLLGVLMINPRVAGRVWAALARKSARKSA